MFLVTNRVIGRGSSTSVFGETPSPKGPNELRLLEVNKAGKKWKVGPVNDELPVERVKELNKAYGLDLDTKQTWHGSLEVACKVFDQAKKENKSILFFVHGYNNDVEDVLKAACEIEVLYNAIVIPFTWPANGGGVLTGTSAYLSDKSDARASSGAFNRFVQKIHFFHSLLSQANLTMIKKKVDLKYKGKDNPMAAAELYSELLAKECKVKINLLCHSMGNYLLKHSLMTSDNAISNLVFDNINLVAADANNQDHAKWLDKIDVRNRIHVVINEGDAALKASRIKPGKAQGARLGHYLKGLNSEKAIYIDVSDADGVGVSHSYFKGSSVENNTALHALFDDLFNGGSVEKRLTYFTAANYFKL
jgi:hypothetical protein